jgi:hypothetical protein
MGLTMQEKEAVARQVRSRYQKAGRKEKSAILDEFIKTTGYKNRKYALRALNKPQTADALIVVKGKAVKLRPPKKRPATRSGFSRYCIFSRSFIFPMFRISIRLVDYEYQDPSSSMSPDTPAKNVSVLSISRPILPDKPR